MELKILGGIDDERFEPLKNTNLKGGQEHVELEMVHFTGEFCEVQLSPNKLLAQSFL